MTILQLKNTKQELKDNDVLLGYFEKLDNHWFYIHLHKEYILKNEKKIKSYFLNGFYNPIFINSEDVLTIQNKKIKIIIQND